MKKQSPALISSGKKLPLAKFQAFTAILTLAAASASASTVTWQGTTAANWNIAASGTGWTPGVPTSSDVITNAAAGATTYVNSAVTVAGINMTNGGWKFNLNGANRSLTVNGDVNMTNSVASNFEVSPYNTTSTSGTFALNGGIMVNSTANTNIFIGAVANNVHSGLYTPIANYSFSGTGITLNSTAEVSFNVGNSSANLGLVTFSGTGAGIRSINLRANGYTALNQTWNTTGLNDASFSGTSRIVGTTATSITTNAVRDYTAQIGGTNYLSWTAPISHTVLAISNTANYSSNVYLTDGNRGTLSITKAGAGTQTLSGNSGSFTGNDFTGSVTINEGTLQVGGTKALGFGGVNAKDMTVKGTTVNTGGTLDLGGFTVSEKITLNGGKITSTAAGSTVSNGLAGLAVTASGSDFTTSNRTLTFTGGGGSGAAGVAVLGLTQSSIATINSSTGWVAGDTFVVSGGGATRQAVYVVDTVSSGAIATYHLADAGYGYTSNPANGTSGVVVPGGRTLNVTFSGSAYQVVGVQLTASGSNYTSAPTISVAGKTITATSELAGTALSGSNTVGGTQSLTFASGISGTGSLTKVDSNTVTMLGQNTYTGDTTINEGTIVLGDNAQQTFLIGASGVNNKMDGTGTLTLDGDFVFDLTGAGANVGDSWQIVNVDSLTESFGATFSVLDFTDNGDNTWTKLISGPSYYQFSETTGMLTVVPEPQTWAMIIGGLGMLILQRRRKF